MKFWPFNNQEKRDADVGQEAIEAFGAALQSGGVASHPAATAAVETATRAISLPFGLARITGDGGLLGPSQLIGMARDLMLQGNFVAMLDVTPDGLQQLLSVASYEIGGQNRPVYALELAHPDGRTTRRLALAESVIHVRLNATSANPFQGVAPWRAARVSSDTLFFIERSLSRDAEAPTGYLLPIPDGAPNKIVDQAKGAMFHGKGALTLIETTAGGFGGGAVNAPRRDYEQKRFGGETPPANLALRDSTANAILACYGVHQALQSGDGLAQTTARRALYLDVIEPLAAVIVAELSLRLGNMVTIDFSKAEHADHMRLSRALASYLSSGVPYSEAVALLGLDLSGTRTAPARPGVGV